MMLGSTWLPQYANGIAEKLCSSQDVQEGSLITDLRTPILYTLGGVLLEKVYPLSYIGALTLLLRHLDLY